MGIHKLLVFFLICLLPHARSSKLTKIYDQGPVSLGENAKLWWTIDDDVSFISMGVIFNASDLRTTGLAWLGIGVGEDTSGGMLGADIFSAVFDPNVTDSCAVKSRNVPFVSYPIRGAVYPVEDDCQSEKSWALVSCTRQPEAGTATFEIRRPLSAFSKQDRAIGPGEQSIMYAFGGNEFRYHDDRRATTRIILYKNDGSYPDSQDFLLPKDVAQEFDIIATNYSVPPQTTYACTAKLLNLVPGESRYIVGAEPVLEVASGRNRAHHFTVFTCEDNVHSREYLRTFDCGTGAVFDPKLRCTQVYVWAVGGSRFLMPKNVGFKVDNTNNMIIMETHYDNPVNDTDAVDLSGTRFFLSKNRSIQAGLLQLGDPTVSLGGQIVKSNFNYTSTCPSSCTGKWKVPHINVFASFLHMHTTGKHAFTNRYDANGSFIETMNTVRFWSNDHQVVKVYQPEKKISRAETLSTTCIFDTTKAPNTIFGAETKNEMCMDFLFYYPAVQDGLFYACGGFFVRQENFTGTMCGDPLDRRSFSSLENPSFNDSAGDSIVFGEKPLVCEANSTRPKNQTSPECFPGDATVRTRVGVRRMDELAVGDEVDVGGGLFSRVYLFTHRDANARPELVVIRTPKRELALTSGHLLYVNGNLARADAVSMGDMLFDGDGTAVPVLELRRKRGSGLYNPQTVHGDIVVNGVRTSTYTQAVQYRAAHALLAPLRATARWAALRCHFLESDRTGLVRWVRGILN